MSELRDLNLIRSVNELAGDICLEQIRQVRKELVSAYVLALEAGEQAEAQALGAKVGMPMTVEEESLITDALGRVPGTML